MIPVCRVERWTREIINTVNFRPLWNPEQARRPNNTIRTNAFSQTVTTPDIEVPDCTVLVPSHLLNRCTTLQPVSEVPTSDNLFDILQQLRLVAEMFWPAEVGGKRVRVQQTRRINPTARVTVLPPGSARLRVFLENRER